MATVTPSTARRRLAARQPSLLDPEPPPPGGFVPPAARRALAGPAVAEPAATAGETLEDLVLGTWGALATSHTAACPLCGGDLTPRYSAGARPVGGRCRTCRTELS